MRPTGSYWGGAGEQIDMRSGNLNFTVPLFKVNGRGWTVPFNLTYNSQVWRQDPGGTWNFGGRIRMWQAAGRVRHRVGTGIATCWATRLISSTQVG